MGKWLEMEIEMDKQLGLSRRLEYPGKFKDIKIILNLKGTYRTGGGSPVIINL